MNLFRIFPDATSEVNDTGNGYYQAAKSWYAENYEAIFCSRNWFRLATIGLSILLALSLICLSALLPLKQYYYRILTVNQQTGEVAVLKELEGNTYTANWAMTHYFISQYVNDRESYSIQDIKRKLNQVIAMSDSKIADSYVATTVVSNPKSPINTLKGDYYRTVDIAGIDKLNEQTALVRFKIITHNSSDVNERKAKDWHAIVRWRYVNDPATLPDRDKNPLGFKVTYYQLEPVYTEKEGQ